MDILTFLSYLFLSVFMKFRLSLVSAFEKINYEDSKGKCEEFLAKYAYSSANFTLCFIEHARPIAVCQKCVDKYSNVLQMYDEILQAKDIAGYDCKSDLLNVDRLEVLQRNYEYVTEQWKQASCKQCFNPNMTELNDDTKRILELHNLTKICEDANDNSTICTKCADDYMYLNDFYDTHKSFNGFCMDIVDLMNSTRFRWSISLGCCTNRRKSDASFYVAVTCTCVLPVVFYFLVWMCATNSFHEISYQRRWTQ